MAIYKVKTGIYAPLPSGSVGLLIGRSSLISKGIHVHIGIIDTDFKDEILGMVSTSVPYCVMAGDHFAQLIIVALHCFKFHVDRMAGRVWAYQQTGIWQTFLKDRRPVMTLQINRKLFTGLVDSGADVTIIASESWPKNWPL